MGLSKYLKEKDLTETGETSLDHGIDFRFEQYPTVLVNGPIK